MLELSEGEEFGVDTIVNRMGEEPVPRTQLGGASSLALVLWNTYP
jgi:hypothetical protein